MEKSGAKEKKNRDERVGGAKARSGKLLIHKKEESKKKKQLVDQSRLDGNSNQ